MRGPSDGIGTNLQIKMRYRRTERFWLCRGDMLHLNQLLVVVKGNLTLVLPKPKRNVCVLHELEKGTYSSGYLKRERQSWQEAFLRKVLHGTRTNRPRPQYLHLFSRRPSVVWVLVRVLV